MKQMKALSLLPVLTLWVVLGVTPSMALTIEGAVKQPLTITADDLGRMESVSVRVSELTRAKEYRGTFTYRGVPLRSLLELVNIAKEEGSVYQKPIDLAVVVRNKEGKSAVLSWGELFYRNPGEVLVAISAVPIGPHHTSGCGDCHGPEVYQPALDQIKRKVAFPKLVVVNDFFTDRCLEDVVSIEVVDLKGQSPKKEMKKLFSQNFAVSHGKGKTLEVSDLAAYRRTEVVQKEVGDGRGYHGLKRFSGVPLVDILKKMEVPQGIDTLILASAPDGYRALFSYGELFLRPEGERILVADTLNGVRLDENGRFILIPPDDLAADRDVKALERIDIVTMPVRPAK
jgi:hypothetical protein